MEFEIKSRFDDLYNHNDWSKDEHKFLKPYACKPDVMYGLCKVYEGTTGNDNVPPFRPILSAIDTGSYNLVKFFVPILKQFTIDIYSVIDSFSFSQDHWSRPKPFYGIFWLSIAASQIFHWIRKLIFCVGLVFERRKKVRSMLKRHFKQLLILSVKSSCFLSNDLY